MLRILVVAFALISFLSLPASAQTEPLPVENDAVHTLGVDAVLGVPVGDYAELVDLGVGAFLRYEWRAPVPGLSVTGRLGYVHHIGAVAVTGQIPMLGGAKYNFTGEDNGPYVAGELGLTLWFGTLNTGLGSRSESDLELAMSLGAGYDFGPVDLRGFFYIGEFDHPLTAFAVSAGFDFASF